MSEWQINIGLILMFAGGWSLGRLQEHAKHIDFWRKGFDDAKKLYKPETRAHD